MTSETKIVPMDSSCLSIRLTELLQSEKYTDCTFIIDNTKINCHKLILSIASPVFEAMLYGPMQEKQSIIITDINLDVFQLMIEYIYTDQLNLNIDIDILMELYYTAEKYLIKDLLNICLNRIQTNLRYTNILMSIDLAVCLNLKPLIQICLKFFHDCCLNNNNFSLIMNEKNSNNNSNNNNNIHLTKNCLNIILKLNIKEQNINLIYLLKEWCRIECNLLQLDITNKDNLINILKDIKVPEDIYDDIININSINISDNSIINSKYSWITCQRTYYKACKPLIIGDTMTYNTTLTTNRFIALKSLIINSKLQPMIPFLTEKYTENLIIELTLLDDDSYFYKQKCIIVNIEYNSIFDIIFDRTIILTPDKIYNIKIIWDNTSIGNEYPRNIFSMCEKRNLCTLNFDKNINYNYSMDQGSMLNGIKYAILNN